MKKKTKRKLIGLFLAKAKDVDKSFEPEKHLEENANYFAVRRYNTEAGQWQFIALSFSPTSDRFYLEVAAGRSEEWPTLLLPGLPFDPDKGKGRRFRAHHLWSGRKNSGGWLISSKSREIPMDTIFEPEGVFRMEEDAIEAVRERIISDIMPFFLSEPEVSRNRSERADRKV